MCLDVCETERAKPHAEANITVECTRCSLSLCTKGNEPVVLFSLIEFRRTVALGLSGRCT